MAEFVKVGTRPEIPVGTGKTVELGGKRIVIFNASGTLYAVDDTCPHQGGPLGEGSLEGNIVTCPWHGWQYDVASGENARNPDIRVRSYAVKTEGEDIFVAV